MKISISSCAVISIFSIITPPASCSPSAGLPGKTRLVPVVQTNLLNKVNHPLTIIYPLTTKIQKGAEVLRVLVRKAEVELLQQDCDIMIDQIRAIDNNRLIRKVTVLPSDPVEKVKENTTILLDLD